ncbi:FadR/GntR family transcriptional regulator [Niallia oryzisoli]|uniref:FadR/GntR family transcriptional regulator n=1 Tax=Niallia oryzisoli TaxID=1737571 RepID=A0ABZ2CM45_9BACI
MFDNLQFDRSTVPSKIVETLKTLIQEDQLKSGEKLPSERTLAHQLNVSRNTIREAYKILSTLGFIDIKQGNGVFVSDGNDNLGQLTNQYFIKSDQFDDLFEIRMIMETQTAAWTAERADDSKILELYDFVKETLDLIEKSSIDERELSSRDHTFHIKIAELSKNTVAFRIMHSLTTLFQPIREETAKIPDRLYRSWVEHLEIAEMLNRRDASKARTAMENHLNSVERTLKTRKGGSK